MTDLAKQLEEATARICGYPTASERVSPIPKEGEALVRVNYSNHDGTVSHHYDNTWANDDPDMFCPFCAVKGRIWTEQGIGDYEVGAHSLCLACGASLYLDNCSSGPPDDNADQQRLAQIRLKEVK